MKKFIAPIVALLLLAACTGGDDSAFSNPAYGDVTVVGDALIPFQDPNSDAAVGQPAPSLSGVDPNGAEVTFTPGENPTVLVFLAHWCPHCQAELPVLADWVENNPDTLGVDIFAVATGTTQSRPNFPPAPWLEREGWTEPVIMDDENGTAGAQFGLTSYPFWVIVDGDGMIAVRVAGELPEDQIDGIFAAVADL